MAKKKTTKTASKTTKRSSSTKKAKTGAKASKKSKTASARKKTSSKPKRPTTRKPSAVKRSPAERSDAASSRARKPSGNLSRKELEQFRAMLLDKRRELIGDVTTLQDEALHKNSQESSGNLSNMPQHMADIGSDNYEQEFALVLVEGERALLAEIDQALKRINEGTFGICQATGKPIGKPRLRAKPWAKYCYEYVLAQETGGYRQRS